MDSNDDFEKYFDLPLDNLDMKKGGQYFPKPRMIISSLLSEQRLHEIPPHEIPQLLEGVLAALMKSYNLIIDFEVNKSSFKLAFKRRQ